MYLKYDLAMPLNIIAGITKDALSLSFFGIYTTIFTFMGMLMNLSVRRFVKENCWTNIFITLLMTFLILSLVETAGCILDNQINFYKVLPWQSILQTSAINSVISPVCFRVLSRLTK
jgi:rod shape-determining protein MreD